MSRGKVERLLNLTLALMATSRPLSVDRIGELVDGYEPADGEAFRRMFERDKEELRELGIPLEVTTLPAGGAGYRIPRRDYALPEVHLDAEEAAALGLAARLWSSASLAAAGASALRKLAADGPAAGPPPPDLAARVDATEPAFADLLSAAVERREVSFGYRRPGELQVSARRLQPWGLVSWHGRWYVAGHDLDRAAVRVFRLSRISGPVRTTGPAGAFTRPDGLDMRALVAANEPSAPTATARLRLRPGSGHALRRDASWQSGDGTEIELPFADLERLAERLAGYGPDVVALAPEQLRAAVVARLRAVLS